MDYPTYYGNEEEAKAKIAKLQSIIEQKSAQIARLREALEPFAKIYAELKTGDAIFIIGKDKKHIVVSLEWFSLAARALEEVTG